MSLARHCFSPGSRQEVNSTWYPEIEEPIKSREKHYSLVLYILTGNNSREYTTQVNSTFRALWLIPQSRNIKCYSPLGGFRRKKKWRANPILSEICTHIIYILKQLLEIRVQVVPDWNMFLWWRMRLYRSSLASVLLQQPLPLTMPTKPANRMNVVQGFASMPAMPERVESSPLAAMSSLKPAAGQCDALPFGLRNSLIVKGHTCSHVVPEH